MENTIPKYHRCNFCTNKNTENLVLGFCVPSHVVGRESYEGYLFHCRHGERFVLNGDKAVKVAKELDISIRDLLLLIDASSPKKIEEEAYDPYLLDFEDE